MSRQEVRPTGCKEPVVSRHDAASAAETRDGLGEVTVSNALPLPNLTAPSAAATPTPRPPISTTTPRPQGRIAPLPQPPRIAPPAPPIPRTTAERMLVARERIRAAAEAGQRIRSYEVALDLDLSEFHFARQFRAAFARSPHVFYDEVRADRA